MKHIIITAATLMACTAPVMASDFYVGGSFGSNKGSAKYNSEYTGYFGLLGESKDSYKYKLNGASKSIFIGTYGVQVAPKTSVGAEVEFTHFGTSGTADAFYGSTTTMATLNNSIDAKVMVFHNVNDKTTVYLGAGVTKGNFDVNYKANGLFGLNGNNSHSSTGGVIEAGVEHKVSKKLSVRASVTHRRYGNKSHGNFDITSGLLDGGLNNSYSSSSSSTGIKVGLVFKF